MPDFYSFERSHTQNQPTPVLYDIIASILPAIRAREDLAPIIEAYRQQTDELSTNSIVVAQQNFRSAGNMYIEDDRSYWPIQLTRINEKKTNLKTEYQALANTGELGFLFLFHSNGFVRQKALQCLPEGPRSAFEFAGIAYRLNDWAEPVRAAAYEYAVQYFPKTSSDVIASAAFFLLPRIPLFKRWSDREKELLFDLFERPDVLEKMVGMLTRQRSGKINRFFKELLRKPSLDPYLHHIMSCSELPTVRATALEALVMKKTRWFTGYGSEWIDKSMGLKRRVALCDERRIEHDLDITELMAQGIADRSPAVRKTIANCLIALREHPTAEMNAFAKTLSRDKSYLVRQLAEFYLKNLTSD